MMERRCKHTKRKNLLVEQEVRRETTSVSSLVVFLGLKDLCRSKELAVLFWKQEETFQVFFFWEKERFMYVAVKDV